MSPGRVALVTGGGSGLGRAGALAFGAAGMSVVVVDLDRAKAAAVADEVIGAGGQAFAFGGDVSDANTANAIVDKAVQRFGGLDYA